MPRDLEASRQEEQRQNNPLTCTLGGETFTCVPTLAFATLIDLAYEGITRVSCWQFLHAAIVDEDIDRLEAVLRRKNGPVTGDEVIDAVHELVDRYSGRPTGRPSESPDGPLTTGPNSKDDSFSPGETESAA